VDSRPRTIIRLAAGIRWPEQFEARDSEPGLLRVKKEKVRIKGKGGFKTAPFRIRLVLCPWECGCYMIFEATNNAVQRVAHSPFGQTLHLTARFFPMPLSLPNMSCWK